MNKKTETSGSVSLHVTKQQKFGVLGCASFGHPCLHVVPLDGADQASAHTFSSLQWKWHGAAHDNVLKG